MGHSVAGNSSGLRSVLNALVQSIRLYRQRRKAQNELMLCSVAEVSAIARDLNLSPDELMRLVTEKTETAAALHELLAAIGIDAHSLELQNPFVMRELQRQCVTCSHKSECAYHLSRGSAVEHYQDFCPNSFALEDLKAPKPAAWRGRGHTGMARETRQQM